MNAKRPLRLLMEWSLLRRFFGKSQPFWQRCPGKKQDCGIGREYGTTTFLARIGPRHGAVDHGFGHQRLFRAWAPGPAYQTIVHFTTKTVSDNAYRPPATINAGTSKHNRKHQRSGTSLTPRACRSGATLESDLQLLRWGLVDSAASWSGVILITSQTSRGWDLGAQRK